MSTSSNSRLLGFETSGPASSVGELNPRYGRVCFRDRVPIDTPHFIAISSRGAVPHLSQDTMRHQTSIPGIYTALEDFLEKAHHGQRPVVYDCPAAAEESPLRKFIALQKDALLVLGPRRIPPIPGTSFSTSTAIQVFTSLGNGILEHKDYVEAIQRLRPDIAIGMGDVMIGHKPSVKRADVMGDRTLAWVEALAREREDAEDGPAHAALFAPILPINRDIQSWYLNTLRDELSEKIQGIVLYEIHSIEAVPANLHHLPKLYVGELDGPHKLLDAIAAGIDLFAVSFVTQATEAGIALNFLFPFPPNGHAREDGERSSLGLDIWSTAYATDLSSLRESCECYTCVKHHRAYVHHLLNAKEMLAWVLLQIHNHHTLTLFFEEIKASLRRGNFELQKEIFQDIYRRELPAQTGQGPRVRGYTFKSEGKGEGKKNPVAWNREMNDGKEKLAESTPPGPDDDAAALQGRGFAEKAE